MWQTLLLIPHEVAGLTVFGVGWVLIGLAVALSIRLLVARKHGEPISNVLATEGIVWAMAAIVVSIILPWVELKNIDGEPVGTAIRGYGVMLLTGVASAVALAAYRAKRRGIQPELIWNLAPWAFFGGIVGARAFFVIQYWDRFVGETAGETIGNVLRFTEGGLVVYGSFIGGFLAVSYYLWRHQLPVLKLGDVIVPCMFLGVFFGRIGCLMNGCCYGGRCEDSSMALHFPPGAKVYDDQLYSGELVGITFDEASRKVTNVRTDSLASEAGIDVGQTVQQISVDRSTIDDAPRTIPAEDVQLGIVMTVDGRRIRFKPDDLPTSALPVRAAQVISSISALVLCFGLCAVSTLLLRTGTVMMLGFASYAVLRFVLEIVRVDEAGQFGTNLSISQWVSVFVFAFSIAGLFWIHRASSSVTIEQRSAT